MGLSKAAAQVLMREGQRRPLRGRVLTLGKQDIYVSAESLRAIAASRAYPLKDAPARSPAKAYHIERGHLSDRTFFEMLGFDSLHSIDVSDYEGAAELFDLNSPSVPAHLESAFDFIVDGGTLEHIFHLPNVLNNIFRMLKVDARVLHLAPSSNHMDHGFYMFSPTLFVDFYAVNRFEVNRVQVFRHTQKPDEEPWEFSDYVPGCLDPVSFGGLDDSLYGIALVATKQPESTGTAIPAQGAARALAQKQAPLETVQPRRRLVDRILGRLRRLFPRPRKKGLGLPVDAIF
jgi:hypothetical protein